MSDWQPIETAPKDGTWILVCRVGDGMAQIGTWSEGFEYEGVSYEGIWEDNGGGLPLDNLTHWMPLPDPPKEAA